MKRLICFLLCLLLLAACSTVSGEAADIDNSDTLTLFAINVGKADCLLLSYDGFTYMIDTGTAESYGAVSSALAHMGINRLDGIIVTHTDKDHAGGAEALATSSLQVDRWYTSAFVTEKRAEKHPVVQAAALRGEEVTLLQAGDVLPFGRGSLTVIGPLTGTDVENCNSVVLLAQGGGGSMLLAGDMEFPEEKELLAAGSIPRCQVLKVGNHGEDDATSDALIAAVMPQLAVISTNSIEEPDTPSPRVLRLLKRAGAHVALTQNSEAGVLVTMHDGQPTATLAAYNSTPDMIRDVTLTGKDVTQDTVTLTNQGTQAVDLTGWFITSSRGGEIFVFPETVIQPGQSLVVAALDSNIHGDLTWQGTKVWHKSKEDIATLYDVYGRTISELK